MGVDEPWDESRLTQVEFHRAGKRCVTRAAHRAHPPGGNLDENRSGGEVNPCSINDLRRADANKRLAGERSERGET